MRSESLERLRAHARSIVRSAWLESAVEADVEEEITGHLIEQVEAAVAGGMTENEAVRTSIADFGDVAAIGPELGRTYHTRLWASSIGILLAAREAPRERPGAIGALRLLLAVSVAFAAVGAVIASTQLTPTRAVLGTAVSLGFIASACLAYRGLAVGQRWSLGFALVAAAGLVLEGVVPSVAPPPGTTVIPVLAIAAAATLLWVWASADRIRAFVAGSTPIGWRWASILAIAVVLPIVSARLPAIADPTQASASDVEMQMAMICGRRDTQIPDGPLLPDRQYADLTVDLFWRRSDLLPQGLAGVFGASGAGDTAGFRILGPAPIPIDGADGLPRWLLGATEPAVRVVETGEVAGWFGATTPSVDLIPETIGSFTVGIDQARIRAGETIRISWSLEPTQAETQDWPRIEVAYAHLDRFVLFGRVRCGERTTGSQKGVALPGP